MVPCRSRDVQRVVAIGSVRRERRVRVMEQLAIYLVTGAISGTLAGLLGVGGGIVIVPSLIFVFALEGIADAVAMHTAVGTSLAIIVLTSLSSIRAHHRRGAVRWEVVRKITPGILVGALLGAAIADALRSETLRLCFGLFALLLAGYLAFGRPPQAHRRFPGRAWMGLVGTLIGAVSSLVGVGGGSMSVPFFVWCNVPVRQAVATAAAVGLPIAVGGTLGFVVAGLGEEGLPPWSVGYLYGPAWLMVALASVTFAPLGARIAHAVAPHLLRRFFALLLLVVGVRMLLF